MLQIRTESESTIETLNSAKKTKQEQLKRETDNRVNLNTCLEIYYQIIETQIRRLFGFSQSFSEKPNEYLSKFKLFKFPASSIQLTPVWFPHNNKKEKKKNKEKGVSEIGTE